MNIKKLTTSDKIAVWGLVITIILTVLQLLVQINTPEIRCRMGLDKCLPVDREKESPTESNSNLLSCDVVLFGPCKER